MFLDGFENLPDAWGLSGADKRLRAVDRKEAASEHYRAGRVALALLGYKAAQEAAPAPEDWEDAGAFLRQCKLNLAACCLRLGRAAEAAEAAEAVLREEPRCFKALLRGAAAALALGDPDGALSRSRLASEVEPGSREARGLLARACAGQRAHAEETRRLYRKMMAPAGVA